LKKSTYQNNISFFKVALLCTVNVYNVYTRSFISIFFILILVTVFFACKKTGSDSGHSSTDQPNIILILADDIGFEVPTCNGGSSYSTPAIDKLAANGVRFTQGYSCPNCCPSRVELLTGKYNFRNYTQWGMMETSQRTIANILRDKGYKTCVTGKWQLGGGASSIQLFGFDNYLVFEPFQVADEQAENKYRYKNPHLYENGRFLPDSITNGKYADDLFVEYISDFIDNNLHVPFFIYYPMSLCHAPFSPTPDDPEYTDWDPSLGKSKPVFFPSMVKYMDKKIQQLIDKVTAAGLYGSTIFIFMGDNGTPIQITSQFNGKPVKGGKSTSTVYGTHVPLIISCPGYFPVNKTSDALADLSDFLPTLTEMGNISIPGSYNPIDGHSFYNSITGKNTNARKWIYCYWKPEQIVYNFKTWVQDSTYKLYDSTNNHYFYNIAKDPLEMYALTDDQLTVNEQSLKKMFDSVLVNMH